MALHEDASVRILLPLFTTCLPFSEQLWQQYKVLEVWQYEQAQYHLAYTQNVSDRELQSGLNTDYREQAKARREA